MMKLFWTALSPIGMLWTLAESRIWLSIAILTVVAGAAALVGQHAIAMAVLAVMSLLLMRADAVLDAQRAAKAA